MGREMKGPSVPSVSFIHLTQLVLSGPMYRSKKSELWLTQLPTFFGLLQCTNFPGTSRGDLQVWVVLSSILLLHSTHRAFGNMWGLFSFLNSGWIEEASGIYGGWNVKQSVLSVQRNRELFCPLKTITLHRSHHLTKNKPHGLVVITEEVFSPYYIANFTLTLHHEP